MSLLPLDDIRSRLSDPRRVAKLLGIEPSKAEKRKWRCPRHSGSSLSLRVGADGSLQAKCFGCDFGGGIFELVAEVHGLDNFRDVAKRAAELAGVCVDDTAPRPAPPPRRVPPPPPSYPDDAAAFWDACDRLELHRAECTYLAARGIEPGAAAAHGLLRVLPALGALPRWARCAGQSWRESGHTLIAPVFDAAGELRSVRAWRTRYEGPGTDKRKRLAPLGFNVGGLVLADLDGRALLAGEGPPRMRALVVEGEADLATAALVYPLTDRTRPAILGVFAGGWSAEIAARIPDGARVSIDTDPDGAGDKYATTIAATLAGRCDVRRVRAA